MDRIKQNIRAPYIGASFLFMLILTTTIISMEPELKQRLLANNQNDIKILIEQQSIEDCSICYEEREVRTLPCAEGGKHPKICNICLDGCHELCPYCRRKLTIEKKHTAFMDTLYQCNEEGLCLGCGCASLAIYLCMVFSSFS